jgi:c-di-AMP phosphodiesterase-like protein
MDLGPAGEEREIRAARNQALFRAVNEKLKGINEAFEQIVGKPAITCECADLNCIGTVAIGRDEYADARADPRHFIVLRDHMYPDVERVVNESDGYVIVEKLGVAGRVAEATEPEHS